MPDGEWKLKTDDNGNPIFQEGKPVYLDPEGKELALDPVGMYQKIIDLGRENKKHRERAKEFENKLKLFDGIEDLQEWKTEAEKALETVKNFNEKDWLKAEKVEKMKADMKKAFEEQEEKLKNQFLQEIQNLQGTIGVKDQQIRELMVSNRFATSPLFSGPDPKTILPPEIAETYFGRYFKVEEDDKTGKLKLVAYYPNGDPIYSRTNPGELADFDEAVQALLDQYPGKEKLLRTTSGGSGAAGGQRGATGGEGELAKLEEDYKKAVESNDMAAAIAIKNQMFKLRQEAMSRGRAA